MRDMANALGWSLGRLQHYEDVHGKPYLPAEVYSQVRDLLMSRGIDERQIRELLFAEFAKHLDRVEEKQSLMQRAIDTLLEIAKGEQAAALPDSASRTPAAPKKPH